MTTQELVEFQISLSTAEEERTLFEGVEALQGHPPEPIPLPAGAYRIIDGHLYRIVPGLPEPE